MKDKPPKNPATLATHAGRKPMAFHGAVNTPIYYASTILFANLAELRKDGEAPRAYGRLTTPTTEALTDALVALEGGSQCVLTPSGLSAIAVAILSYADAGDHILLPESVYMPTRYLCRRLLKRYNVRADYYDPRCGAGIADFMKPETKIVFTESPGTQTMEVQDIPAIAKVAHARGAVVAMDNTWATPVFFPALHRGVDVSIQSGTKYLIGHSDALLGTVTVQSEHAQQLLLTHRALGLRAGPEEVFLALRGLRTLPVRLQQHHTSGIAIAKWLEQQKGVSAVLHPALPSSSDHKLWKRDFTGAAGLFSIVVDQTDETRLAKMLDQMRLFKMGYSWGGFESLILPVEPKRRFSTLPKGQMLRLHVGLEAIEDLQEDLADGLARLFSS